MHSLTEIQTAFDSLTAQGFTFFFSHYSKKYHITLTKSSYTGSNSTEMTVKGEGDTITECVEHALNNFPKNPLDGSRWKTDRLAAPEPVEEGTFTETDDAS